MKYYTSEVDLEKTILKAELGDVDAMVKAAFTIIFSNPSEEPDPSETSRAIRYYKMAAEAGNKSAMLDLAACYMDGRGVERNVEEAFKWYNKGFDENNPSSCFCLGCVHRYDYTENNQEIQTKDLERLKSAFRYFNIGAELCDSDCLYEIGDMYFGGIGVEQDFDKAFKCFQASYEYRDKDVISDRCLRNVLRLITCHRCGYGTEVDSNAALIYLEIFDEEWSKREEYGNEDYEYIFEQAMKEKVLLFDCM